MEMRDSLTRAAEEVCGMSQGGRKRCETKFWGEEIKKMVKDKRRKFLTQYRTKEEVHKRAYWESKRMVKKKLRFGGGYFEQ